MLNIKSLIIPLVAEPLTTRRGRMSIKLSLPEIIVSKSCDIYDMMRIIVIKLIDSFGKVSLKSPSNGKSA
jgi:hypothetical protein